MTTIEDGYLSLLCSVVDLAVHDYRQLVKAGIVRNGEQIASIESYGYNDRRKVVGMWNDSEVKQLLEFFHNGDFGAVMESIVYPVNVDDLLDKLFSDVMPNSPHSRVNYYGSLR